MNHEATSKGAPLVSLPNFGLLENPSASTGAGQINPFYQSQPAPIGLTDFGLGVNGPYSYNTSHINSQILFETPPFATAPGTAAVINPGGDTLGYVNSPLEFSIQLNTVTNNFTIPGSSDGTFWTQNVLDVDMYAGTIHFVDDVFNLTGPVTAFKMGSIAAGCGLSDVSSILEVYGGVYQCVGPTIPIPGFPLTVSLYNNASYISYQPTNTSAKYVAYHNDNFVTFGYRFSSPTSAFPAESGISDNVTFLNPDQATAPANKAGFSIDGYTATPSGLDRDAEIILGGPIGGANAVFNNLTASMSLYYSNATTGGWKSVPSAYDFGGDTGETATGIATYWTTAGTEELNQGPSFLYGLWGAMPHVSVAAGDIQYQGTLSPDYGFVFLSNVAPGRYGTNFTILPTNPGGGFDTYLPALVPPGTGYYVQAFADGYTELNGTTFSATSTGVALTMTAAPAHSPLRAPLYMWGDTQATQLALAVISPTATTPYTYNGLTVDLNISFNHLNDWSYPSFALFQEFDVGDAVTVNNTVQGPDSGSATLYYYDDSLPTQSTGFLEPGPTLNSTSRPNFSLQFNSWNADDFTLTNETLQGPAAYGTPYEGGLVFLYDSWFAEIGDVTTEAGDYGVFVSNAAFVYIYNIVAKGGSNGVDDVDNFGLFTVYNVTATGPGSFGIEALDTEYSVYERISASDGAAGVYAGAYVVVPYYAQFGIYEGDIYDVNATSGAAGAVLVDCEYEYVEYVNATDGAVGIESNYTYEDEYQDIWATGTGIGVFIYGDLADFVLNLYIEQSTASPAAIDELSEGDDFQNVIVNGAATGLLIAGTIGDSVQYVWDNASSGSAVEFLENIETSAEYVLVNASGTVGVNVTDDLAFLGEYSEVNAIGPLTFSVMGGAIIILANGEYAAATDVNISGYWLGIIDLNGLGDTGIELFDWAFATVSGTYAANDNEGVYLDDYDFEIAVSDSTAVNDSLAVDIEDGSEFVTVTDTTATDVSTGVFVEESGLITITGVTASNAAPWIVGDPYSDDWGPSAAVFTDYSFQVSISDVVATNFAYGLFDEGSGDSEYGAGSLYVQNLALTDGYTAVNLDGTYYGDFSGIGAYHDIVGVYEDDGGYNVITASHFVDNTYFGVALYFAYDDTIWDNTFIGNNGATSTYSAANIQAYSTPGDYNAWDYEGIGNYWSDWQLDPYGQLYPYVISNDNVDYDPLNVPAGETAVWFFEEGLASGVSWSVTFGGVTQTTTNDWMVFGAVAGSYTFSAGAVAGYTVSPASGSIGLTAGTTFVDEYLTYTAVYTVTLTETGLAAGTTWSAIVGGVTVSSDTATINVTVPAGNNAYQIPAIAGYTASPRSGTIDVTGPYSLSIAFTVVTYAVTVTESGLASGQSWMATVTGVSGATQTSTGTSITFYLPNGSYSIVVANVSGYSLANGKLSVTVDGSAAGASVSFTPVTSTSVVSTDTFNTWLAVLIAIAVIALVIGLLALFLRRGKKEEPPQGAQPWTPPAGTTGGTPPASGGSGSSGSWSEGPPAGGSPPS